MRTPSPGFPENKRRLSSVLCKANKKKQTNKGTKTRETKEENPSLRRTQKPRKRTPEKQKDETRTTKGATKWPPRIKTKQAKRPRKRRLHKGEEKNSKRGLGGREPKTNVPLSCVCVCVPGYP